MRSKSRYNTWNTATAIPPRRPLGARSLGRCKRTPVKSPACGDRDESVLVAALRGDDPAFRELEARFRLPLLSLARRWAPDIDRLLHEDIVQEIWSAVSARVNEGRVSYDPDRESAIHFLSAFVPNAAQRVRSQQRPAGERSRSGKARNDSTANLSAGWRWRKPESTDLADIEEKTPAPDEIACLDARIDIALTAARAEPNVALAITLIVASGATMSEAAKAVGLSPSTFSRRLSELGHRAA